MDPREQAFRGYLLELLEEARKIHSTGYVSLELSLNHHNNVISGGFNDPTFAATFYASEQSVLTEESDFKELIKKVTN
jgi:hypothetical protein